MADQKKWFKVWASILNDPAFQSIRLEDMARWMLLGAMICQQGENGKLTVIAPALWLLPLFRVTTIEDLKVCILRLPNVQIQSPINDNGDFIVLMRNWYKYQVDTTHTERQKRARYKKRGEEKRSITSTSTSPSAARAATLLATPPLAGNGHTEPEVDYEKLEQQEANKAWRPNTKKNSKESEPKIATPQEVKAILDQWRKR